MSGDRKSERIGSNLVRIGKTIYFRDMVNGKRLIKSTGTNKPSEAREWLKKWNHDQYLIDHGIETKGVVLQRQSVTVGEVVSAYVDAGCPSPARSKRIKSPVTVVGEEEFTRPLLAYFSKHSAASVTLASCDKYLEWRNAGGYVSTFERGVKKNTQRGRERSVDLELTVLSNALTLAVRRGVLHTNPLDGRGRYRHAADVRHAKEVAATPKALVKIVGWLRGREKHCAADLVSFIAYSGLRIGEALSIEWEAVDQLGRLITVRRAKRGINPWVPILPEMDALLTDMRTRATSYLLFPAELHQDKPADYSAMRRRLKAACEILDLPHATFHGLRSHFATRCLESGLSPMEVAQLLGDKTSNLITTVYGDVLPAHLIKQTERIRLTLAPVSDETS